MGCGWGYGNYRNKNDERVVYDLLFPFSLFIFLVFGFSGGILGWDPVHTTCIFCERSYEILIKLS